MRKRPSPRFLIFTFLLVAVLSLFPLYSYYKQAAAPVPPGVTLGGVDVTGLKDPAAIRAHMAPIYQQPIGVKFQERMLVLHPEEVGFTADVEATIADAGRYLEGLDFVDIAVREAIGLPQQRRDVALRYTVDEDRLRTWLERTAASFDYAPVAARVRLPETPITATAVTAERAGVAHTICHGTGHRRSANTGADPRHRVDGWHAWLSRGRGGQHSARACRPGEL